MIRKVSIFVVGWVIVIVGLVLVPLPGPGWAIVFVGLSLLATEFAWAARLKDRVQQWLAAWVEKIQAWRAARRRKRSGLIGTVLEEVDTVAHNAEDDSLIDVQSLVAPRHRPRKEPGTDSIAS